MATAYLMYGFAGAGKTTVARRLERETRAVRFSSDAWIAHLYGLAPQNMGEVEVAVKELTWEVAAELLERDISVILDFGFWSRAERDEARRRVREAGGMCELVFVDAPFSKMKRRVAQRNASLSPDTPGRGLDYLYIDDEALEAFKSRFEPLGSDEKHVVTTSEMDV